eukprot:3057056-Pleurochrysis_carterae.AAC.1
MVDRRPFEIATTSWACQTSRSHMHVSSRRPTSLSDAPRASSAPPETLALSTSSNTQRIAALLAHRSS